MPKPNQKSITVPKRVFDELKTLADAEKKSIPKLIEQEICKKKEAS